MTGGGDADVGGVPCVPCYAEWFVVSVNLGLWKVLASSVVATSGAVAVGLAAVPVLIPPAPVATSVGVAAPEERTTTTPSTSAAGWTSAADQYATARAERALQMAADKVVAGSPWGEVEWLSGGGHAVRVTAAPEGKPTQKRDVEKKAAALNAPVADTRRDQTRAAATADTKTQSDAATGPTTAPTTGATTSPSPVDGNGSLGSGTGNGEPNLTPATPEPPTATPAPTPPPKGDATLRLVQANIKTSMDNGRWFADYARVKALNPDFITLNEASTRTDEALTAGGYGIHRAHHDASTRETPVLWRLDTWDEISSGTRYLSTRRVKWGIRAVNWVTVKNLHTGRVVSVISAHPAPTIPVTRGLLPEFMQGLAALTRELGDKGPVFIGGDLNVHYQSDPYPRAAFASAGLQPTFDTLGRLPTGDRGAVIDYLLYQPGKGVTAVRQGKVEQNSDHHTIWADFTLPR